MCPQKFLFGRKYFPSHARMHYNGHMLPALARAQALKKAAQSLSRPTSSFSADYDVLSQTLQVYFPNGSQLTYHGIPLEVGLDFENSPSGAKFNSVIRGNYF